MNALKESINKQKKLMGILKESQEINILSEGELIEEGLFDSLKTFASGISNAFKNISTNFSQGKIIKQIDIKMNDANKAIIQITSILNSNASKFKEIENLQQQLSTMNLDQATMNKYNGLLGTLNATFNNLTAATQAQEQGMSQYQKIVNQMPQTPEQPANPEQSNNPEEPTNTNPAYRPYDAQGNFKGNAQPQQPQTQQPQPQATNVGFKNIKPKVGNLQGNQFRDKNLKRDKLAAA